MSKLIITISIICLLLSCTDEKGAKRTLEVSGYKPINVGGYGWLSGSKDDVFKTKFTAISPSGYKVSGCVTKGIFKGSTIRLDD